MSIKARHVKYVLMILCVLCASGAGVAVNRHEWLGFACLLFASIGWGLMARRAVLREEHEVQR